MNNRSILQKWQEWQWADGRGKTIAVTAFIFAATWTMTACSNANDGSSSSDTSASTHSTATEQSGQEEAAMQNEPSNTQDQNANGQPTPLQPQQIPNALLQGETKTVYAQLSPEFQKLLTEQQLADTVQASLQHVQSFHMLGKGIELNHHTQYSWLDSTGKLGLIAVLDQQNRIAGLQMQPVESFPTTDAKLTDTVYRLPFQGDWFVFWGGNNVLQNYHYAVESQRYAYDFIQVKDGMSYSGDATINRSYYAFGQPVLSPADGTVVAVVNDILDNEPVGKMNPAQPAGNHVVIRSGSEYSLLGHLQKSSVTVKRGDTVQAGQIIGKVGNSGNSSEAHLHVQVADDPDLAKGKSIPIHWQDDIQPIRGQTVNSNQ